MGNINFIGVTHGFIEYENIYSSLPSNAIKITEYADDMNIINLIIAVVPIIVIVLGFLIKNIRKYDVTKDLKNFIQKYFDNNKKYKKKWQEIIYLELKVIGFFIICSIIFLIISMISHELLHAICEYIFGKNVIIGFDIDSMIGYVKSLSHTYTKFQKITVLAVPALTIGIFPILIGFYKYKNAKNKLIVSLIILLSCVNISLCCADFIDIYNYIKYVPNGAIIYIYDNETYYIPK